MSWNPVTEYPLSDHVHFRVNVPQNATSGEFTVNHPDGSVEHLGGIFCMFGTQRAFTTGLEFTGCCLDDEWSVSCVVHCGQSGDLTFGPTSFDVRNLSVGDMSVTGGGDDIEQSVVFVSVAATATGTTFTVVMHDGIEVLPSGADPNQWVVDAALTLVPLVGGAQVATTASGAVADSTLLMGAMDDIQPGLYYKNVTAHERMLSAPSGGPDTAQAHSSQLTITSATRDGFEWGGEREGSIGVHLHTDPPSVHPTASLAMVRRPDGSPGAVDVDMPTSSDETVTTSSVSLDLGGTYQYGLTLNDEGGNMHDDAVRWAVPKPLSFTVPACAHFVGTDYDDLDHDKIVDPGEPKEPSGYNIADCTTGYGELGEVDAVPPILNLQTFYSGRPEIGERGGVVSEGTHDNFLAACLDDDIVQFSGHGFADGIGLRLSRLRGDPPNQYTQSEEWFVSSDIVSGGFAQVRVAVIGSCNSMDGNDSIGHKFVTVGGAQSAVGYVGHIRFDAMAWVHAKLWYYLAKEQRTVQWAANQAREDYKTAYDEEQEIATGVSGIHVAPSPCSTVIYPAF